tara:strand:- start:290 stop:943 length:654 start_codon:yes stop_codon:yes gene_type:complete
MTNSSGLGMTSDRTRLRMVSKIKSEGISNRFVLSALESVPRHLFVDEAMNSRSYDMVSLPIGYGQTISHPYIVARLCELALPTIPVHRVLDVGTGCGYQAAVLSKLAGEVFSIERNLNLLTGARVRLKKMGFDNIRVRHGDGFVGLGEMAPFDAIIVAAAAEEIPLSLTRQLKEGGVLVIPIGKNVQKLTTITRENSDSTIKTFEEVKFVPLLSGTI